MGLAMDVADEAILVQEILARASSIDKNRCVLRHSSVVDGLARLKSRTTRRAAIRLAQADVLDMLERLGRAIGLSPNGRTLCHRIYNMESSGKKAVLSGGRANGECLQQLAQDEAWECPQPVWTSGGCNRPRSAGQLPQFAFDAAQNAGLLAGDEDGA